MAGIAAETFQQSIATTKLALEMMSVSEPIVDIIVAFFAASHGQ